MKAKVVGFSLCLVSLVGGCGYETAAWPRESSRSDEGAAIASTALSRCGGFTAEELTGLPALPPTANSGADSAGYCDAEVLRWAYDADRAKMSSMAVGIGLTKFMSFSRKMGRFYSGGILDFGWGGSIVEDADYEEDKWESEIVAKVDINNRKREVGLCLKPGLRFTNAKLLTTKELGANLHLLWQRQILRQPVC